MAGVRRKQDDKNLKILREIVTSGGSGGNRQCFDCGQKGPTYVNMTIGSFVCTRCSGVLRGLTPPHRVKSISMATFTPDEIEFLKINGNDVCAKTWLGLWDPKRIIHQEQRELMIDKYERKRYFLEPASPLKSLTNSATKLPAMNGGGNLNGGSHHNNNNNNNNSSAKHTSENNLKNITLTPPSSLRLTSNNNPANCNSSSSSNRQQNRYNFQNQFTPEENGFFDSSTLQNGNNNLRNNNNTNGNNTSQLANGLNGGRQQQVNNNKNSLNISAKSSSDHSVFPCNKFTPDSDFVADFGSAHIFNATANGSNQTNHQLNGIKIYQNGTAAGTNNNHQHGHGNNFVNGGGAPITNGSSAVLSNANANFADFDHAPIYNAVGGLPMSINSTSNSLSSSATFTSNSSINSTPPADRYAALKDLDEQLREIKTSVSDSFSTQAPAAASPNPFKQSPTTVQPPQQQIGNPFQQPVNLFASNQQPQSNAFGTSPSPIINYNNGYSSQSAMISNGGINNGCGMGYHGTAQQVSGIGSAVTNMKNPFAVSSLNNSNNPFL